MSTARIFQNGGSQAVRLPKEFRFDTEEVSIERDGDRVILAPLKKGWSKEFWACLDQGIDLKRPRQPAQRRRATAFP